MIHTIDLHFQTPNAIAAFVVETSEGPVVVETGPHSVFANLEKGLQNLGYSPAEVKHVFLSHIHFDHAGAAWAMAEKGATVYVHPKGYKHMLDPTRLYNSAKRIYQDQMESLWGLMKQIPENQLVSVEDEATFQVGSHSFKALYTPGHAKHHIAWQLGDIVFTGDVAGCRIDNGPVVPPCPPPDIDIEAWMQSVARIRALNPKRLYITHFGLVEDVQTHLDKVDAVLLEWSAWIKPHFDAGRSAEEIVPEFSAYADQRLRDQGLSAETIRKYEAANPAWMSVAGLLRYWQKKTEAKMDA